MDNVTAMVTVPTSTTVIDWVTLVITGGILIAAVIALLIARWQLQLQAFVRLLEEIGSDEASRDRGIVRKKIETGSVKEMQVYVGAVRERLNSDAAEIGRAAERTIARLDRVGFFLFGKRYYLFGKRNRVTMYVPEWLWTVVNQQWEKLGYWVTYRQTETSNEEERHRGYGYYFASLALTAKEKIKKELKAPYPMIEDSEEKGKKQ